MTPNMQMEQLSLAYIRAVAADAGYVVSRPDPDIDSVDGILMSNVGRRARLEFQAKATSLDLVRDGEIHFPLPVKNYDDLRRDSWTPRILIVVLMPGEGERLSQTTEELCLRRCAYWLSLNGRPMVPNAYSVTVNVPMANVFDKAHLDVLMATVDGGRMLC